MCYVNGNDGLFISPDSLRQIVNTCSTNRNSGKTENVLRIIFHEHGFTS